MALAQKTKSAYSRSKKYSLDLSRYYRTPSMQVSLSIVLSLFIVAFFVMVAIRPTFVTITGLNKEIEESEKKLAQLETKVRALESASQVWESIQPSLPSVEAAIPSNGPEYPPMTRAMEIMSGESGTELASFALGEALLSSQVVDVYSGRKRDVIEQELSVRVSGSFTQVLTFLTRLMAYERLAAINSVTITREVGVGTGGLQVGLSAIGTVQYLADPTQLGKVLANEGGGK